MVSIAIAILCLALAGALASWIVGAYYVIRTLVALGDEDRGARWLAVFAWPFAIGRLQGRSVGYASNVNKALVGFMVCVMIALAATAVTTNMKRMSAGVAPVGGR
jgi:hypothetical protein